MTNLSDLQFIGQGLQRPECVLAHSSGYLLASDVGGTGGVSVISPSGDVRRIVAKASGLLLKPNGIALLPDGGMLLAHLGQNDGGVYRLDPDGSVEAILTEIGGSPFPPTNFVLHDARGRTWITVSTRKHPRQLDYRPDAREGFIVLIDSRGARIVADGLGYTNECAVHPDGERLFVNETFARRVTAFTIRADGTLANREVVATFGAGTFPDGLAFDAEGGLWITSIVSNRVIRVAPDGAQDIVLEDVDLEHLARVEEAFQTNAMGASHLAEYGIRKLRNVSSLAFGGADLRTAYLGSLLGDGIAYMRAPLAGLAPAHWKYDIDSLKF